MITQVVRVGDEFGIVLEPSVLEFLNADLGDKVDVEVREDGSFAIYPISSQKPLEEK